MLFIPGPFRVEDPLPSENLQQCKALRFQWSHYATLPFVVEGGPAVFPVYALVRFGGEVNDRQRSVHV